MATSGGARSDPLSADAQCDDHTRCTSSAPVAPLPRFPAARTSAQYESSSPSAPSHGASERAEHAAVGDSPRYGRHHADGGIHTANAGRGGRRTQNGAGSVSRSASEGGAEWETPAKDGNARQPGAQAGMPQDAPTQRPEGQSRLGHARANVLTSTPSSTGAHAAPAMCHAEVAVAASLGSSTVTSLDCSVSLPQPPGHNAVSVVIVTPSSACSPHPRTNLPIGSCSSSATETVQAVSAQSAPVLSGSQRQRRHNPYSRSHEDVHASACTVPNVQVPPNASVATQLYAQYPVPTPRALNPHANQLHSSCGGRGEYTRLSLSSSNGSVQPVMGLSCGSSPVGLVQSWPATLAPAAVTVSGMAARTVDSAPPRTPALATNSKSRADTMTAMAVSSEANGLPVPAASSSSVTSQNAPYSDAPATSLAVARPGTSGGEGELIAYEPSAIRVVVRHSASRRAAGISPTVSPQAARETTPRAGPVHNNINTGRGGHHTTVYSSADDVTGISGDWHRARLPTLPLPLATGPLSCSTPDNSLPQDEDGTRSAGAVSGPSVAFRRWWGSLSSSSLRGRGTPTRTSSTATSRAASSSSSHLLRELLLDSAGDAELDYSLPDPSVPVPAAPSAFRDTNTSAAVSGHAVHGAAVGGQSRPASMTTWQPPARYARQIPHCHTQNRPRSDPSDHAGPGAPLTTAATTGARVGPSLASPPLQPPHVTASYSYLPTVDVQENAIVESGRPTSPPSSYAVTRRCSGPAGTHPPHSSPSEGGDDGASRQRLAAVPVQSGHNVHDTHLHPPPLPRRASLSAADPPAPLSLSTATASSTGAAVTTTTTTNSSANAHTHRTTPSPTTLSNSAMAGGSLRGFIGKRRSGCVSARARSGGLVGSSSQTPLSAPSVSIAAPSPTSYPHALPYWVADHTRSTASTPTSSGALTAAAVAGAGPRRDRAWSGLSGDARSQSLRVDGSASINNHSTSVPDHPLSDHPPQCGLSQQQQQQQTAHDSQLQTSLSTTMLSSVLSGRGQERVLLNSPQTVVSVYVDDYTFDRHSSSMNFEDPAAASVSSGGPNYNPTFLFYCGASSDEERGDRSPSPQRSSRNVANALSVAEMCRPPALLVSPHTQPLGTTAAGAGDPPATSTRPSSDPTSDARQLPRQSTAPPSSPMATAAPHGMYPRADHAASCHDTIEEKSAPQSAPSPYQQPRPHPSHQPPRARPEPTPLIPQSAPLSAHGAKMALPSPHSVVATSFGFSPAGYPMDHGARSHDKGSHRNSGGAIHVDAQPTHTTARYAWGQTGYPMPDRGVGEARRAAAVYPSVPFGPAVCDPAVAVVSGVTGAAQHVTPGSLLPPAERGGHVSVGGHYPTHNGGVSSLAATVPAGPPPRAAPPLDGLTPPVALAGGPPPLAPSMPPHHQAFVPVPSQPHTVIPTFPQPSSMARSPPVPHPSQEASSHERGGGRKGSTPGAVASAPAASSTGSNAHTRAAVDPRVAAGSAPTVSSDELIARTLEAKTPHCPAGWYFSVYNSSMDRHYALPSEDVFITQGAIKYVQLFERHGLQTRFRFQLCRRFVNHKCDQGTRCIYIHASAPLNATRIHINENTLSSAQSQVPLSHGDGARRALLGGVNTKAYPTLAPGFAVEVWAPNQGTQPPRRVASEMLLRTKGSENLVLAANHGVVVRSVVASTSETRGAAQSQDGVGEVTLPQLTAAGAKKLRHCAHFQFKGVCHLGEDCSFIHSLVPYVEAR